MTLHHVHADKPLMVLVDTSVLIHKLHQSAQLHHSDPNFASVISANIVWLMSGEWLGSYKGNLKQMVFCTDSKPYWRTEWLQDLNNVIDIPRKTKALQKLTDDAKEILAKGSTRSWTGEEQTLMAKAQDKLGIHYKAGRKLPEYSFTKTKKIVFRLLEEMGANVLGSHGYEADDMIAALTVVNSEAGNQWDILDLTVDSDHMQLINDSFTWMCMTGYAPTIRDTMEVCNEWSLRRLKTELTTWHDIVRIKGDKGDASDNLPPSAGTLIPVIDLVNPPVTYRYWLRAPEKLKALFAVSESRFKDDAANGAVLYLRRLGSKPVVNYVPGQNPFELLETANELEYAGAF